MAQMVSIGNMIAKLRGMIGTKDLNAWETNFVAKLAEYLDAGRLDRVSDRQLEVLEELHKKHFA